MKATIALFSLIAAVRRTGARVNAVGLRGFFAPRRGVIEWSMASSINWITTKARIERTSKIAGVILAPVISLASAETVRDREGAVRGDRAKMEHSTRWIYQDVEAGFAEAKRTGKPLMVVLRCVPCLACMGIDTQVLVENPKLTPLLDQFVRVRLINANALDLSKFQFDYDLSFSTLFFNGDGTIYGRYGSWEHQKDAQNTATASFGVALEGALTLHRNYPGNKAALAGKQGKPSRFARPIDVPLLQGKYEAELNWSGKVVQSCVHCHTIGDSQRLMIRNARQKMPTRMIYPFPPADVIGLTLDNDLGTAIARVASSSPSAKAGLKPGDILLSLSGQPLISTADVSWALHHSPDSSATLPVVFRRGTENRRVAITLPEGWRESSDISRRVGTWPMRMMALGGIKLEELPDDERRRLHLRPDQLGLIAKHVGQYGKHAAAKRLGFRKGDILVEILGNDARLSEGQLIGKLMREFKPGQKVPVTVLRGDKRLSMKLPSQ